MNKRVASISPIGLLHPHWDIWKGGGMSSMIRVIGAPDSRTSLKVLFPRDRLLSRGRYCPSFKNPRIAPAFVKTHGRPLSCPSWSSWTCFSEIDSFQLELFVYMGWKPTRGSNSRTSPDLWTLQLEVAKARQSGIGGPETCTCEYCFLEKGMSFELGNRSKWFQWMFKA